MTVRDRIAHVVASHGPALAVALVALGAVAFGIGVSEYTAPATTEVTDRTNPRTFAMELDSSALVTGNTSLYERGTRLSDPPVYLADATPVLDLELVTRVPEDATVALDRELRLVYVARRGDERFWRNGTPLAADEPSVTGGNDTLRAELDAGRVRRTLSKLRDEVGSAGTVAVRLELRVTYRTDDASGTLEASAPIRFERDAYTVGTAADERTHATPVTRTVSIPAGDRTGAVLATALGGLGVVVGVLVGAVYWLRFRDVDPGDLALRVHRTRYGEWISTGTAPVAPGATVVEVDTLEDLVDVAIDSDARAIHDRDREVYVVFNDGVVYRFDPAGSPPGVADGDGSPGGGDRHDPAGSAATRAHSADRSGAATGPDSAESGDQDGPPGDGSAPVATEARATDPSDLAATDPGTVATTGPARAGTADDAPDPAEPVGDGGVPGTDPPGPERPADPNGYDVGELRDLAASDPTPDDPEVERPTDDSTDRTVGTDHPGEEAIDSTAGVDRSVEQSADPPTGIEDSAEGGTEDPATDGIDDDWLDGDEDLEPVGWSDPSTSRAWGRDGSGRAESDAADACDPEAGSGTSGVAEAVAEALDPEPAGPVRAGPDAGEGGSDVTGDPFPGGDPVPTADRKGGVDGPGDAAGTAWFRRAATGRAAAGGDATAGSEWCTGPPSPESADAVFGSALFGGPDIAWHQESPAGSLHPEDGSFGVDWGEVPADGEEPAAGSGSTDGAESAAGSGPDGGFDWEALPGTDGE